MPLEKPSDYNKNITQVTYLEAVGRTIAGIAPWLALPDDESDEGILRKQVRTIVVQGLSNVVNPNAPDYLNFRTETQPLVDAAFLAQGFLRAPQALWEPLDNVTKQRYIIEFQSLRTRKRSYNNWLLFAAMTETFLLSIHEPYDPVRIDYAIRKMKEWYVGDGWYSDGEIFSMDYYNSFVIHPMLLDILKVLVDHKLFVKPKEYDTVLKRTIRYAEFIERTISPECTFPIFGRSITYRTAIFQALTQIVLFHKLPNHIQPSQVRCALTCVVRRMFVDNNNNNNNNNFDKDGCLILGFNGHQPQLADTYTSTGSLYMATLGFLPLGLPVSDPFWTDPCVDWTSKKIWNGELLPIKRDYKVNY